MSSKTAVETDYDSQDDDEIMDNVEKGTKSTKNGAATVKKALKVKKTLISSDEFKDKHGKLKIAMDKIKLRYSANIPVIYTKHIELITKKIMDQQGAKPAGPHAFSASTDFQEQSRADETRGHVRMRQSPHWVIIVGCPAADSGIVLVHKLYCNYSAACVIWSVLHLAQERRLQSQDFCLCARG